MRQLMFITIMTTLLSPLAIFQQDDPFGQMGRMSAVFERVEALRVVTTQARRLYGRLETILCQRVEELADQFLAQ